MRNPTWQYEKFLSKYRPPRGLDLTYLCPGRYFRTFRADLKFGLIFDLKLLLYINPLETVILLKNIRNSNASFFVPFQKVEIFGAFERVDLVLSKGLTIFTFVTERRNESHLKTMDTFFKNAFSAVFPESFRS